MNIKIVMYHEIHGELILSGSGHWSMDIHQTYDKLEKCGWKVLHANGAQGFVDNSGKHYTRAEAIQFIKGTCQQHEPVIGNHESSVGDCDAAFSEGFW